MADKKIDSPTSATNSPSPNSVSKSVSKNKSGFIDVTLFLGAAVILLCGIVLGAIYVDNDYSFVDPPIFVKAKKYLGIKESEPGVRNFQAQDAQTASDIAFTVHFNGDGLSDGIATKTQSAGWKGLDDLIETTCKELIKDIEHMKDEMCKPNNGARLFTHYGVRCYSLQDIRQDMRTYVVPQGVHFVWPIGNTGDVIEPECVESPVPGKPIRLRQLSQSPRVFTIENFMTAEEMEKVISHNKEVVTPSEVGFAGWKDDTRTSSTSWDFTSWAAKKIQRRSFDVIGMPYDLGLADAVQVLRYRAPNASDSGKGEWYKPHTDWFDAKGYDGHDPTVNNGTNRFATVFLYLTNVPEGGHTVFPLSKTHEGYNGEELVHAGTENTAGYIANKDAAWVCNTSSTALRSQPIAGSAVLFYSQGPAGDLDKFSLHGGCPVLAGEKWSANVWIWNRPKPSKSDAKDGKPSDEAVDNAIKIMFRNSHDFTISVYWDDGSEDMLFQLDMESNTLSPMTTYAGHRFVAKNKQTGEQVSDWRCSPEDKVEDDEKLIEL